MYRRNRYSDTSTGRFTQEDPLGLAGGMNAYGYADGDPINFDDPFGLSPDGCDPPGSCESMGALVGTAVGGGVGLLISGACATVTLGACALAGPELTLGLSGFGASIGLAIGTTLESRRGSGGKGVDRDNTHPQKKQSGGKSRWDKHSRRHGQRNPPYSPNKKGNKKPPRQQKNQQSDNGASAAN